MYRQLHTTMGLDIYFEKRNRKFDKQAEFEAAVAKVNELDSLPSDEFEARRGEADAARELRDKLNPRSEVAYFRNVNFLMPFFNYEGNCEYIEIAKCQVEDLIDACNRILATKHRVEITHDDGKTDEVDAIDEELANELLPTQCGFFFGGTEYGEYYIYNVTEVRDRFSELLDIINWEDEVLEMYCWW